MKKLLVITVAMLSGADMAMAQNTVASPNPSASPTGSPGTATAPSVVVTSEELDISREQIVPSLGATRYTVGPDRLGQQSQGQDAPFNQTILRFPGVAQDSFGQVAQGSLPPSSQLLRMLRRRVRYIGNDCASTRNYFTSRSRHSIAGRITNLWQRLECEE